MEERGKPRIYLLVTACKNQDICGYFTNGKLERFWPFDGFEDMTVQVRELLKQNTELYEPAAGVREYRVAELPKHWRLIVVEIYYQQHDDWQGVIYGINSSGKVFKSRGELKELINRIGFKKI